MVYKGGSLDVTSRDRRVLESWLRAPTTPQSLALRAKILLASAGDESLRAIAERLEVAPATVKLWRRRYREEGLVGIRTRERSGRPKTITAAKERSVVAATMRAPKVATHWSTRRLALRAGRSLPVESI